MHTTKALLRGRVGLKVRCLRRRHLAGLSPSETASTHPLVAHIFISALHFGVPKYRSDRSILPVHQCPPSVVRPASRAMSLKDWGVGFYNRHIGSSLCVTTVKRTQRELDDADRLPTCMEGACGLQSSELFGRWK
jgi:hypothetical protein